MLWINILSLSKRTNENFPKLEKLNIMQCAWLVLRSHALLKICTTFHLHCFSLMLYVKQGRMGVVSLQEQADGCSRLKCC